MRIVACLSALVLIAPSIALSQLSGIQAMTQASIMSRQLELAPYVKLIKKGEVNPKHAAIIRSILRHTNEVCIHQQNGASANRVFVSEDGHKEAVYGEDGKLVQDGINDGSYNYYHPSEEPLRHFSFDISPWIMWGNSREDSTTVKSRIYAYMGDLEGGVRGALANKIEEKNPSQWKERGQIQAVAVFMKAVAEGGAEELFTLFEPNAKVTDRRIIEVLTKLNAGLDKVYSVGK
jgi:hypothetical protein